MCAYHCGINVTIENDEIRYIESNPNHTLNKGAICAKGSAGIMKQCSPARLTKPLKRKESAQSNESQFEVIEWDKAFEIMKKRLSHIRAIDPKKFALFTGHDQMQALTRLFAKQYGTPNYAAHGGFCSVNMASGFSIAAVFAHYQAENLVKLYLPYLPLLCALSHSLETQNLNRNQPNRVPLACVMIKSNKYQWVP